MWAAGNVKRTPPQTIVRTSTVVVRSSSCYTQRFPIKHIASRLHSSARYARNRHYKRASGALLVYDVTSRSSFENAERVWLRELRNAADSTSSLLDCLVIVGNKVGTFAKTDARRCGLHAVTDYAFVFTA